MARVPTITLHRDGKTAIVNVADAGAWIADGWSDKPPAVDSIPRIERERKHRTARSGEPDPPILQPDD